MQRKTLRFDRRSRDQVMAYFTRPGMGGVVQKLASSLKVPFRQHKRMNCVIKKQKKARAGEHSLMESMLTVLSGKHGPYFRVHNMEPQHLRGLLLHMGHNASGMSSKDCERAIMKTWADQVRDSICISIPQYCLTCYAIHCAACALVRSHNKGDVSVLVSQCRSNRHPHAANLTCDLFADSPLHS